MFEVIEKVESLRNCQRRTHAMSQVDGLIEGKKIFTLELTGEKSKRTRLVTCDLYNESNKLLGSYSSSKISFADSVRHIGRQLKCDIEHGIIGG